MMLSGISPESSIRYLSSREDDSSVFALSLRQHPLATQTLIEMARDSKNPRRQKKTFYWITRSKDPKAQHFVARILRSTSG